MLLVRDPNRAVAAAVVRSPLIQEGEVVLISRNRSISDEVLRIIGTTPEWTRSYAVKKNLVENPKTPVMIATQAIVHLREFDLRQIARSKNVTGPVQEAARRLAPGRVRLDEDAAAGFLGDADPWLHQARGFHLAVAQRLRIGVEDLIDRLWPPVPLDAHAPYIAQTVGVRIL